MEEHARIKILGVGISAVNPALAVKYIQQMVAQRRQGYVCVAPVSTLVDSQQLPGYKELVNQAAMVTPDGVPVAMLCRLKGAKQVARTYGPDLVLNVCQIQGLKHFFYGGTSAVLEKLQIKLTERNPQIQIVGAYAPDYSPQAKVESSEIIDMINASSADIVWVALGSPKQDWWMALNRPLLNAPVLVGIGAAVDFISGAKPQAPRWMQRCALEWLFRLGCEPKRLWRRYLIGNTLFIFYLIRDLFKKNQ